VTLKNELRSDDRVAVITGAGGGLGHEYALPLASQGARIVVNDIGGSVTGDGSGSEPLRPSRVSPGGSRRSERLGLSVAVLRDDRRR
jgi:NAD(P)-dependent dehydrogenase (short-subunit alcohol dehydrogenase family)